MTMATMQTLLAGVAAEHGSVLTEFTEDVFLRYRQRVVFQDPELLVRVRVGGFALACTEGCWKAAGQGRTVRAGFRSGLRVVVPPLSQGRSRRAEGRVEQ